MDVVNKHNRMDVVKLSPASYHLLNEASVPFLSRLKLCRVLWVSKEYNVPRKYQLLVNWICGQVPSAERSTEFKPCFKTAIEFLNARKLSVEISAVQSYQISLKPSLFQAISDHLQDQPSDEVVRYIITFGEIVFMKNWIICATTSYFAAFAPYLSQWIWFLIGLIKSIECEPEVLPDVCKHVAFLVERTKQFIKGLSAQKKALQPFCKHLLMPLLELHYRCSAARGLSKYAEEELSHVAENTIAAILFSREHMYLFDEFSIGHDGAGITEANRRHKKVQKLKRVNCIMSALQEISSKASHDLLLAAHSIKLFFRLFLTRAKSNGGTKVDVLQELARLACLCDKCDNKILACKSLNVPMIHGLLQLTVEHQLYQPAVNEETSGKLVQWLKDLLQNLLNGHDASSQWISCMLCLTRIDKSIVEPWMKSIIAKSIEAVSEEIVPRDKVFEFIHCLVDTYVKIRQSVRLVKAILLLVENEANDESRAFDLNSFSEAVEEFGRYLAGTFASALSPSLIIEIWEAVLQNIEKKVIFLTGPDQSRKSSASRTLQLFVKIFVSISSRSPIFALWDHLTVRKQLDECFATLERSVKLLQSITGLECGEEGLQNKVTEIYLNFVVAKTELESTLKRYAVSGSEIIKPGFQKLIFQNDSDVAAVSTKTLMEIRLEALSSEDSKLAFLHLGLLRMKSLTEDVQLLKLFANYHQIASDEATQSGDVNQDLVNTKQRLVDVFSSMKLCKPKYVSGCPDLIFVKTFSLFAKFLPILLHHDIRKLYDWMNNAVLLLLFQDDLPSCSDLAEALSTYFYNLSSVQKDDSVSFDLLKKGSFKLSEIMPKKFPLDAISNDVVETTEKANPPVPSNDDVEVISSGLHKHLRVVESLGLGVLQDEHTLAVFDHTLRVMKLVCFVVGKLKVREKFENVLDRLVKVMLCLVDGRRMQLLWKRRPDHLLPFIARLHSIASRDSQRLLTALQHELILLCYQKSSNFEDVNKVRKLMLVESGDPKSIQDQAMCMISQQTSVLITLVSFGDRKHGSALQSESRKRKLRTDEQISKKLKLDNEAETAQVKERLLLNLQKQYNDSCKMLITVKQMGKNYYEMLSMAVEALSLLKCDEKYTLGVNSKIQRAFENALKTISLEEDTNVLASKLEFMKRCVQCEAMQYSYQSRHIHRLVSLFIGLAHDEESTKHLNSCLVCLLRKVPAERYQKDVFDEVIRHIRAVDNSQMNCYTKFATVLISCGILGNYFENDDLELQKVRKRQCSRFLKRLLEELLTSISKISKTTNTVNVPSITCANACICEVLKTNWVKFQATEICNSFASLLVIQLETIHLQSGPEAFFEVFKSCHDVVHCILATHGDVRQVASICIATFRHLLKAAIYLGMQKKQSEFLNDDKDYRVSVKCSGILEKLFQLVADKHKKDFSKCMSYIVADYICIVSSATIVPSVKKSFANAIYHLMSMMDEYDTAMIRRSLPVSVRDAFQALVLDHAKNFKYKGFV